MQPYIVRPSGPLIEAWSGYRIQFDGMERQSWQKDLKAELKSALSSLDLSNSTPLAGFYDSTDAARSDVENSLFTNVLASMPRSCTTVRFERGTGAPPPPPVPIDRISGHLHYYRYRLGGRWCTWEPTQLLARWTRLPRRVADDVSARPVWLALREGNIAKHVEFTGATLSSEQDFGLRLTVHATRLGPRNAITYCERLVDGVIAAFHDDRYSAAVVAALAPKLPKVTEPELRAALSVPAGPLFTTPAVFAKGGFVQISPADERCVVGEVVIQRDSESTVPELSGELFAIRRSEQRHSDDRAASR